MVFKTCVGKFPSFNHEWTRMNTNKEKPTRALLETWFWTLVGDCFVPFV